jgi:hypothetical protein
LDRGQTLAIAGACFAFLPPGALRALGAGATPDRAGGGDTGLGALTGADATGAGAGMGDGTATGAAAGEMVLRFMVLFRLNAASGEVRGQWIASDVPADSNLA